MKNYPIAAALLLAFVAQFSQAATLQGRVVGVADGDTITVLSADKRQYKIRLAGIDAPEKKQAFGSRAKETLSRLVFDQPVTVEYSKWDRYGRIVGKVELGGHDVNLELLREGSAWVYRQYVRELSESDRQLYLETERKAQRDSAGLWRDREPEPPWEWRRTKRGHGGPRR